MKKIKRSIKENIRKVIILFFIIGFFYIVNDFYKEKKIRLVESSLLNSSNLVSSRQNSNEKLINDEFVINNIDNPKSLNSPSNNSIEIKEELLGYKIDGILQIPKINLEAYIFDEYSEERMNISPTKLWGPKMNEFGNYSIIGHNYKKENMFNNLIELEVGDKFYLTDKNNKKLEYTIYDIYKVKENNIEPIKQGLKENIEVTLITCVNYTNNRLIVKAISEV